MKHGILGQYMMSDSREVGRNLLASMESIEEMEVGEEKKADAVEEASSLALRIGRDFPEDSDMHASMFKVLEGMGATEGLNASNESLADLATKLSGFWRKPKPDTKHMPSDEKGTWSERDKAIRQFIQDMEKTYLDSKWLDKQKFVEGTVPAKDISGNFQIDGKPVTDPLANIEQHRKNVSAFIKAWHPVLKDLDSKVQAIHKKAINDVAFYAKKDEQAALDVVRKATAELNDLPDPTEKFPSFSSTAMGNMIPVVTKKYAVACVVAEKKMEVTPSDTLPALDKEGVLKVATLIRDVMKDPKYFEQMPWLNWLDFKDGSGFSHWIYDVDNSLYDDYYERFYWQGACDVWSDDIWALHNKFRVLISLIKWIDRSVK